mmetsp:Transcript_44153/g.94017  ORF Transcript_44153/g.94017 Transcript_44153/m.94017 type:complete len:100 (-) Transcript_44153:651-950(-)
MPWLRQRVCCRSITHHLFGTGGMATCTMIEADDAFRGNRLEVQKKLTIVAESKQRKAALAAAAVQWCWLAAKHRWHRQRCRLLARPRAAPISAHSRSAL